MTAPVLEIRSAPLHRVSVGRGKANEPYKFRGHAAVFNRLARLGMFREQIRPGTFSRAIREKHDTVLLFNHDRDSVMARVSSGSLVLQENARGLLVEADLDPTDADVARVVPKLRRGDLHQMSFAFRVPPSGDVWDDYPEDGGPPIRTLKDVDLFDVSVVTFPAYAETDAAIGRSADATWQLNAKLRSYRLRLIEIGAV